MTYLRYRHLVSIVLIGSIIGFPLVAAVSSFLNVVSTPVSIAYRAVLVFLAIFVLLRYSNAVYKRLSAAFFAFLWFWVFYLFRLVHDAASPDHFLSRPFMFYWLFAFGTCFLPAAAVFCGGQRINVRASLHWTMALGVCAIVVAAGSLDTVMQDSGGQAFDSGRFGLQSLNPIFFGHLGVSVFLIAFYFIRTEKLNTKRLTLYGGIALCGLGAMYASGSRGPIIALVVSVIYFEFFYRSNLLVFMLMLCFVVAAMSLVDFAAFDSVLGVRTVQRMESAFNLADASAIGRLDKLKSAWMLFLGSPVFGAAFEDPRFGIYPHNMFVEAFMATGVVGGGALLYVVLIALARSAKIVRSGGVSVPFVLLFLQYLVGAQFSGGIYTSYGFWALLAFVAVARPATHSRSYAVYSSGLSPVAR